MNKVIITGANGFIGSYLVREFVRRKIFVIAVIRPGSTPCEDLQNDYVKVVECDLFELNRLTSCLDNSDYDCFLHLAWEGSSGPKRADSMLQIRNIQASVQAVEVAAFLKCKRFIGVGSITQYLYGDYLKQDLSHPEPVVAYAVAKLAAQDFSSIKANELGIAFNWAYVSNFYGIGDRTKNFINFLVSHYLKHEVPVLTDGEQLADFIYVSDVARALVSICQFGKDRVNYYVGYCHPQPLKNLVKEVAGCLGTELNTGLGLKKFSGNSIDFSKLDITKLSRDTGFVPEVTLEVGIKKTVEWLKTEFEAN